MSENSSQDDYNIRVARLKEVDDLLKKLTDDSDEDQSTQEIPESLEEDNAEDEARDIVQKQRNCVEKVDNMYDKLEGEIKAWKDKADLIKNKTIKYDPVVWEETVNEWHQAKFEFFVPIVLGNEPDQTLDRFRNMSEEHRELLLNKEADLARRRYLMVCGVRDEVKNALDTANKQIEKLQGQKAKGDSTIAELTMARDRVITERDQAIRERKEATKECDQIRDRTNDRIEVVRKEKDTEKEHMEKGHEEKVKELYMKIQGLTVSGQKDEIKIREHEAKIRECDDTARGLEQNIRDLENKARESEKNAQELEKKTRELEGKVQNFQKKSEDLEKTTQGFQTKVQDLEQNTGTLQREVSRRESKVLGIARFFMNQSGMEQELTRDVSSWIPFVEAIDGSDELEQLEDHDRLRPWTILQTWDVHDVLLADRPNRDLGGHIIHLYGRVLGKMWDEDTIDLIRVIVLHLKTVDRAPVDVLLHLLDKCLESLDERNGAGGAVPINAYLVAFSFWQCANLMHRRLPSKEGIYRVACSYQAFIAKGWQGLAGLLPALGNDSGMEMKDLIRSRRVLTEDDPMHRSGVFLALFDKPVQYCDQDIGLIVMPDLGNRIWALNLTENTIRLVDKSRGKYGPSSEFILSAPNGDGIIVPNHTQRDFDWVIEHLS